MDDQTAKTVAVFDKPFKLPGFDETLPAGEYNIETEFAPPPDHNAPEAWKASVIVHLHPRVSHPGLTRSLSVSLVDLDHARAKDKLSGKALSQAFLEEMLADPMVQLVMQADGVTEAQLRHLYSGIRVSHTNTDSPEPETGHGKEQGSSRDRSQTLDAENEGMPCRPPASSASEQCDKGQFGDTRLRGSDEKSKR
ncbi:hypothetical protein SAMN04488527_102122 [Aliiroseovarius crassostreae]|uniref:hypothetical protein n=1 Tax=Aliiroseovarius crassostreae TaxID=154981 RepID=UPI0008E53E76|nr:hypothetical protein [Aliiroseovarius crassostreae]SFU41599.1 hypothetical protein SAMN04488527_102122 [Aliiroseovarius crassostreae]